MKGLAEVLEGPSLVAYTYSYPHKMAHRPLERALSLRELWAAEDRRALFLYLHVPFCTHRCAYCNLFSLSRAEEGQVRRYLDAVERQAERVRMAIDGARFARMAIGGGTPTLLDLPDLERLLAVAGLFLGASARGIPASVEVSPATAADEKLARLRQFGVSRLSIGVQTFDAQEAAALGRPQPRGLVEQSLRAVREAGFRTLNVDLMYGIPGQTLASWRQSLHAALAWRPEEIYLYPLYVRPMTGLAGRPAQHEDRRIAAYRVGRELLLGEGYTQHSMRMFRAPHAPPENGPLYRCQEDGMVGLGCGARSYTRTLHYSTPYAVGAERVGEIIERFSARTAESFDWADYGFRLDSEDQRRRYVLLGLLEHEGLDATAYAARFASDPLIDLPQLDALARNGLIDVTADRLRLTEFGFERSDAIGPWLYSHKVRQLTEAYPLC
jgi:oxygen-independent coproporphyrinogen-3 oxidase